MFDRDDLVPFPSDTYAQRYYFEGPDDEAPSGGEYVSMFYMLPENATGTLAFRHGHAYLIPEGAPSYVEVPHTGTSSLEDDHINESNQARLLEDWKDHLIHVGGGSYGSECLLVRVGEMVPEELVRIVEGLVDYPLYDEDDYSQRECEELDAWVEERREAATNEIQEEYPDLDPLAIRSNSYEVAQWVIEENNIYRAEELGDGMILERLRLHVEQTLLAA